MASKRLKKKRQKQRQLAQARQFEKLKELFDPVFAASIPVTQKPAPVTPKPKRAYVKHADRVFDYKALAKMSEEELDKIARSKRRLAQNRLKEIRGNEFYVDEYGRILTPAAIALEEKVRGGIIPAMKGMGHEKRKPKETDKKTRRIDEILSYEKFLKSETSKLEGAEKLTDKLVDMMPDYRSLTASQRREFWRAYNKQKDKIKNNNLPSDQILKRYIISFLDADDERTAEEIVKAITDDEYEKEKAKEEKTVGVGAFDSLSRMAYNLYNKEEDDQQ